MDAGGRSATRPERLAHGCLRLRPARPEPHLARLAQRAPVRRDGTARPRQCRTGHGTRRGGRPPLPRHGDHRRGHAHLHPATGGRGRAAGCAAGEGHTASSGATRAGESPRGAAVGLSLQPGPGDRRRARPFAGRLRPVVLPLLRRRSAQRSADSRPGQGTDLLLLRQVCRAAFRRGSEHLLRWPRRRRQRPLQRLDAAVPGGFRRAQDDRPQVVAAGAPQQPARYSGAGGRRRPQRRQRDRLRQRRHRLRDDRASRQTAGRHR